MTLDELLSEVSYKLPKGYPTIVDGKFVDREEVLLINKFLVENGFGQLPLPEATNKTPKKPTNKIGPPAAFAKWWNGDMKNATKRTKFFELIPIVQALQPSKPVTVDTILKAIDRSDLDWGDIDYIRLGLAKLKKDKDSLAYLNNRYLAGEEESSPIPKTGGMVSIYNNKRISAFMWDGIENFYSLVKQSPTEAGKKNKPFTADVILFWGVKGNPKNDTDLQNRIKKAIENPKILKSNPSIVDLGNNQYMACVSLKAGHGRIGKLTAYMGNYVSTGDADVDALEEGVVSSAISKLTGFVKAIGGKIADLWSQAKQSFINLSTKAKQVFSSESPDVQLANKASSELADFLALVQDENPDFVLDDVLQESGDEELICNSCMQRKLLDMDKFMQKFLQGTALNEFDKKIKELSSQPGFVYRFEELDTKSKKIKSAMTYTKKVVDKIKNAQSTQTASASKKNKCTILKVKGGLKRSEIKNIFFIYANQNAITALTNMLNTAFPKGVTTSSKALDAFFKMAVDLNAQSIFGRSGNLPLVKFTGAPNPQQLGTKEAYVEKTLKSNKNYAKYLGKQNLPVVGLRITPSAGSGGENPYYYSIILYTLYTINADGVSDLTPDKFEYAEISFKANSGSDFTFAVEGDNVATGVKVLKTFKK